MAQCLLLYIKGPLDRGSIEMLKNLMSRESRKSIIFIASSSKQSFKDTIQNFDRKHIYNYNEYIPLKTFLEWEETFRTILIFRKKNLESLALAS